MRQKGIPVVAAAPGCPDIKDSSCLYKAQKGKVYLPNSGRTLNEELIKRGLQGRLRNKVERHRHEVNDKIWREVETND